MDIASTSRTPWHPLVWLALVAAAVGQAFVMFYACVVVAFGTMATCSDPGTVEDLRAGQLGLGVVVLLSAAPWILTALVARRYWIPLVLLAVPVSAFPAWYFLQAMTSSPADWSSGWCF